MKDKSAKPEVCTNCGRVRGKYCQPWRTCNGCGKTLCRICIMTGTYAELDPTCHKCWKKKSKEEEKIRKKTPVECTICHQQKLPKYFKDSYYTKICKKCDGIQKKLKEKERKKNARPGLVQVAYGERDIPTEESASGYAYYFHETLKLGDIVEVPRNWLSSFKDEDGPKLATVVSTYSDYQGTASSIIRVVKRAKDRITEDAKLIQEGSVICQ